MNGTKEKPEKVKVKYDQTYRLQVVPCKLKRRTMGHYDELAAEQIKREANKPKFRLVQNGKAGDWISDKDKIIELAGILPNCTYEQK